MATLLSMIIFLLPVPIAFSTRSTATDQAALETAVRLRGRLVWIASWMAAIPLAQHLALVIFAPGAKPTVSVAMYFGWVPWMMLLQYRYPALGRRGASSEIRASRSASLHPRPVPSSIRIAWLVVATAYLVGVIALTLVAWQQIRGSLSLVLPLSAWALPTGVIYWVWRRAVREEPETYPGVAADPELARAYERRRTTVSWAFLVLFVIQAGIHLLLAVSVLEGARVSPTLVMGAATAPVAAGVVYRLLRRRIDRRIETLLTVQPRDGISQ